MFNNFHRGPAYFLTIILPSFPFVALKQPHATQCETFKWILKQKCLVLQCKIWLRDFILQTIEFSWIVCHTGYTFWSLYHIEAIHVQFKYTREHTFKLILLFWCVTWTWWQSSVHLFSIGCNQTNFHTYEINALAWAFRALRILDMQ